MGGIVGSIVGNVAGAIIGGKAAKKAANIQAGAADRATELQREMYDKNIELQAPFREAGLSAQNRLLDYMGLTPGAGGKYAKDFSMQDFQQDPGYAFRIAEGMKALDRTAASRGGLLSGATLRGATRYGQDMASQEYTNAFNRYQTNRANQLQPLQSLMGAGQTAANTLTSAAGQMGQNQAAGLANAAQARASGYVGGANALTGGLNQYMNYTQSQNLLNRLAPTGGNVLSGPSNAMLEAQMYGG